MPAIRPLVGVCLALALPPLVCAAAPATPDTTRAVVPDLTVIATPFVWNGGLVPATWLAEHADGNPGEALEALPGIAMVRRAAGGTEPVIRGLGYERVRTLMGAVPLHGACPGRMDPPVTYLSTLSAPSFSVTRDARVEAGAGMTDRVAIASGDFFVDPLPTADVVTMGNVLHDWDLDHEQELIELGDAFDYTSAQFREWCTEAGFREFEIIPLAGPSSAAVAYK